MYASVWNALQQKQIYGSAWGMIDGEPIAVGNINMTKGMPYFISPDAEGVVTWVGRLPEPVTFEFKILETPKGVLSENYIVLPLNTEIKTAKNLCNELIGKGIMTGDNYIAYWDVQTQNPVPLPKCSALEDIPNDSPLIQLLPGIPYLITITNFKDILKKGKRAVKNIGLAGLIGMGSLFPRVGNAGSIGGKIFDAWNGQTSNGTHVEEIINNGSSGTATCDVPYFGIPGYWAVDSGVHNPEPNPNQNPPDTSKMSGSLQVGSKIYTAHGRRIYDNSNIIFPNTFLDDPDKNVIAHAFGAWIVNDTSNVSDTLKAEGWLNKNSSQKIQFWNYSFNHSGIDTSKTRPDVYFNTEKQD